MRDITNAYRILVTNFLRKSLRTQRMRRKEKNTVKKMRGDSWYGSQSDRM